MFLSLQIYDQKWKGGIQVCIYMEISHGLSFQLNSPLLVEEMLSDISGFLSSFPLFCFVFLPVSSAVIDEEDEGEQCHFYIEL